MSQPEKLSTAVTESPYAPSPIDVEKGLGASLASPTSPRRRLQFGRVSIVRPSIPRIILCLFLILVLVSLLTGGVMAKRNGSPDPRTWNLGSSGFVEEPKEAYPWECRKGLWSCRGLL